MQESIFAQPKAAQRANAMDGASELHNKKWEQIKKADQMIGLFYFDRGLVFDLIHINLPGPAQTNVRPAHSYRK